MLVAPSTPVEVVGRAMAEDALAYHTAEVKPSEELVANTRAIRNLGQPKVPFVLLDWTILQWWECRVIYCVQFMAGYLQGHTMSCIVYTCWTIKFKIRLLFTQTYTMHIL